MSTSFLQRMHRESALSAYGETQRAVAYCLRDYSKPFFVKLILKGGLPTSMPHVPCLQSHLLRWLRPQTTMEEVFHMSFCLGRNGCKGWKDGRGPGWLNKYVGVRSRRGHWKCWVTWGTQIAECAFFPETDWPDVTSLLGGLAVQQGFLHVFSLGNSWQALYHLLTHIWMPINFVLSFLSFSFS